MKPTKRFNEDCVFCLCDSMIRPCSDSPTWKRDAPHHAAGRTLARSGCQTDRGSMILQWGALHQPAPHHTRATDRAAWTREGSQALTDGIEPSGGSLSGPSPLSSCDRAGSTRPSLTQGSTARAGAGNHHHGATTLRQTCKLLAPARDLRVHAARGLGGSVIPGVSGGPARPTGMTASRVTSEVGCLSKP